MPVFVNNVEITDDEVHTEMQYHPADTLDAARDKAAEALIIRQLFLQEAVKQNLLDSVKYSADEEATAIDALVEQAVSVPEADKETCQRYYEQNKGRFVDPKTGKQLPMEAVEGHIHNYLHARSLQTGISQYIKILVGRAKISGFSMEGSNNPLVQ